MTFHTFWPPCLNNNDQCTYPGSFCEPQGTGSSRCATCGNYNAMGYEWDAERGVIYNQMMTDGTSNDENFGGFNMTTVSRICANHSLSVSVLGWVPGATCYERKSSISEAEFKAIGPFEDKYERSICQGARKLGQPSPMYDEYVHNWCSACIIPNKAGEPAQVKEYTSITNQQLNVQNMKPEDWVAYVFCSLLIGLT